MLFTLLESWEDDRIDKVCNGFIEGETASLDQKFCSYFWKPQYTFPNLLQTEEGGFEVLDDFG